MADQPQPGRRRGSAHREDDRSDARERALTILYEAQSKQIGPGEALAGLVIKPDEFTARLVRGVEANTPRFDELIAQHARNWTIERMPVLDVSILRLAMYELAEEPGTPTAVIINEAVELAKRFSTDDSSRFVNGLLSAVAPLLRPLPAQ